MDGHLRSRRDGVCRHRRLAASRCPDQAGSGKRRSLSATGGHGSARLSARVSAGRRRRVDSAGERSSANDFCLAAADPGASGGSRRQDDHQSQVEPARRSGGRAARSQAGPGAGSRRFHVAAYAGAHRIHLEAGAAGYEVGPRRGQGRREPARAFAIAQPPIDRTARLLPQGLPGGRGKEVGRPGNPRSPSSGCGSGAAGPAAQHPAGPRRRRGGVHRPSRRRCLRADERKRAASCDFPGAGRWKCAEAGCGREACRRTSGGGKGSCRQVRRRASRGPEGRRRQGCGGKSCDREGRRGEGCRRQGCGGKSCDRKGCCGEGCRRQGCGGESGGREGHCGEGCR